MRKRIIVQGDDWGYKPEADSGIEYAYEHGILTQTTVMANMLSLDKKSEYRDKIKSLENKTSLNKPEMGVGVHLNLTYGKPMSSNWPTTEFTRPLKGSGNPEEWQGSTWRKYFSEITAKQVEDEYRQQIETVFTIFGKISHLDSHQMTASYPPTVDVYEKLAKEYDVAIRPVAPLSENPVYGGDFVVDEKANNELRKNGVRMADMNVFTLFFNEKNPTTAFLSRLDKVKDGETIEVMFHPAYGDDAEKWRLKDLDTLTNEKTLTYFAKKDIELINYSDI
jgi:predicted glycoside hydrolase/deacetylase ChbG (UPF0249 family)